MEPVYIQLRDRIVALPELFQLFAGHFLQAFAKRLRLRQKRRQLLKRQADIKTQEKSLDKRIAALTEKIKEIERTRLLNMCKERNWTPSDLMDVLESIPEGMDFKTFTKKVNKKA